MGIPLFPCSRPYRLATILQHSTLNCNWLVSVGSVNCCWPSPSKLFLVPSPAGPMTIFYSLRNLTNCRLLTHWLPVKSSRLLMVLASTVILCFWLRREPWPYFCSFQIYTCFEMGPPCPVGPCHIVSERTAENTQESRYDRRSVGQSVLVSSPFWGSWPDINYCLTITVMSMSGAPSDKRSGLSFVLVTWTASVQVSKFAAGPRQLLILILHYCVAC
jgi:hypothetical protein